MMQGCPEGMLAVEAPTLNNDMASLEWAVKGRSCVAFGNLS